MGKKPQMQVYSKCEGLVVARGLEGKVVLGEVRSDSMSMGTGLPFGVMKMKLTVVMVTQL